MMVKLNEYLQVNTDCITSAVKVSYESFIAAETYLGLIKALDTGDRRKFEELYAPTRDGTGTYLCTDIKKLQEAIPQLYRVTYVEGTRSFAVFVKEDYCKKFLDMQPTGESAKGGK